MIIECQRCSKRFRLDETRLRPGGSRVRCSKCGEIFRVHPVETHVVPEPAAAEAPAPAEGRPEVEKRAFPRVAVSIPTLCNSTDADGRPVDLHIGVLKEVGQDGVAIELFPGEITEVVTLSFIGVDNQDVQINGKVQHTLPCPSGKIRIGLSLLGSPADVKQFVTQAVRTHHQFGAQNTPQPGGREGIPAA